VDWQAMELTNAKVEPFEGVAGADFALIRELIEEMRSRLLSHSSN
jgi:hypothetical protein